MATPRATAPPPVRITELPAANPLTGTEVVECVQDGVSRATTPAAIAAFLPSPMELPPMEGGATLGADAHIPCSDEPHETYFTTPADILALLPRTDSLPRAAPLGGAELIRCVQDGAEVAATVQDIAKLILSQLPKFAGAAISAAGEVKPGARSVSCQRTSMGTYAIAFPANYFSGPPLMIATPGMITTQPVVPAASPQPTGITPAILQASITATSATVLMMNTKNDLVDAAFCVVALR